MPYDADQGRHAGKRGAFPVGGLARTFARTTLVAAAMSLAAVVALAAFMWLFFRMDGGEVRAEVRKAFTNGTLIANSGQLLDAHRGDYLFNDCLILQTLLLGRDDWRHSVIDSTIYLSDNPCLNLQQEVTDQAQGTTTYQYSRYIFAARAASAPLLAAFGVAGTKGLLKAATYALLLLTGILCLRALTAASVPQAHPRILYFAGLLCVLAMLGLYRLEFYAQTLSHGYSELIIAAFMLYSMTPASDSRASDVPTAAVVLGVLTGCFELLTGPGLVAVGIAVLLTHCASPVESQPYRRAAIAGFACTAGMLMALFWQQLLIGVFSDSRPFYQFATHLAMRLQLHQYFAIPFEPQWATAENLHLYSPDEVIDAIAISLPALTHGSSLAAQVVFAGSAAVVAAGPFCARRETRPGCIIAAAVGLSLPAWYFAFSNHTVLHSLYMIRMAVLLPICAGISTLFVLAPDSWMAARAEPWRESQR
jgi:hypothetical protein